MDRRRRRSSDERGGGGEGSRKYHDREADYRERKRVRPTTFPREGEILRGRVQSTKEFGAFVRLDDYSSDGLVHISQISKEKVEIVEDVAIPGDRVWVKVLSVEQRDGRMRIKLSMKAVDQKSGNEIDCGDGGGYGEESAMFSGPTGPPPALYSIHRAKIRGTKEFGAFARLDSSGWEGLVHISQLANDHVENPDDVVSVGQSCWVKVTEVEEDLSKRGGYRLGFTMKFVRQSDGGDLDPQNKDLKDDIAGIRPSGARRSVGIDVAMKVSEHGGSQQHHYGGSDTKYELIPDPPPPPPPVQGDRGVNGSSDGGSMARPKAIGRGLSATRPAWMTKLAEQKRGGLGSGENSDHSKSTKKKKKKKKKTSKKKKKKKKKKKSRKKKSKKRKRSESESDSDTDSSDSDSDDSLTGNIGSIEEAQRMIASLKRSLGEA
eukprot:g414.t1